MNSCSVLVVDQQEYGREKVSPKDIRAVAADVDILRSRVKTLKMENEREWRKIEKAKIQAESIAAAKSEAEMKRVEREQRREEEVLKLKETKDQISGLKKRKESERQQLREAFLNYKKNEMAAIKKQSETMLQIKRQKEEQDRIKMAERIAFFKESEKVQKDNKRKVFEQKFHYLRQKESDFQSEELARYQKKMEEMKTLEQLEKSLIQKLRSTEELKQKTTINNNMSNSMASSPRNLFTQVHLDRLSLNPSESFTTLHTDNSALSNSMINGRSLKHVFRNKSFDIGKANSLS